MTSYFCSASFFLKSSIVVRYSSVRRMSALQESLRFMRAVLDRLVVCERFLSARMGWSGLAASLLLFWEVSYEMAVSLRVSILALRCFLKA